MRCLRSAAAAAEAAGVSLTGDVALALALRVREAEAEAEAGVEAERAEGFPRAAAGIGGFEAGAAEAVVLLGREVEVEVVMPVALALRSGTEGLVETLLPAVVLGSAEDDLEARACVSVTLAVTRADAGLARR